MSHGSLRPLLLHLAVIALLFALQFILPAYHHGVLTRIMTLAVFAMGYNILFGYTGLLSLGHAMFFSAGLYGAGLTVYHLGWSVPAGFIAGLASGLALATVIGFLALRTTGVAFMIVTLMFGQIFYLLTLYFAEYTRGEDGLVIDQAARVIEIGDIWINLTDPTTRYFAAWLLFSTVLLVTFFVVRRPLGRVLVAIRENEERTRMLGYDTFAAKLGAVMVSGTISASAGAAYAMLFGYMGATFADVQYSILPLLWVLLGGAATTLGPLIGTVFMYYIVDLSSGYTTAYLLVVGVALIVLILFFPKGLMGTIRERWLPWLP
ncbi:MAG: branched-chain amino acid ABC transporter permease [Brucellaceae bacterium]|nr:branched-chain amino acid ABC transporter permease [Brucellaceae bacterium]